jgi:hypothetical protein
MPKLSKADERTKISANEARRRKEVALAELRELERDRVKGKLLPAADVEKVWSENLACIRDRMLMLPDRLAARLAGRDESFIRQQMRTEIEEALRNAHAQARIAA